MLGLELAVAFHPVGDPVRDKGHQALLNRFRRQLSTGITVRAEVPLPLPGDPRAWDLVLRLEEVLIGVEAETRVRDLQALVRRIHQRQRDGGVDEIVLVLSDSRLNRRFAPELRVALGERFGTPSRPLLSRLRAGVVPVGSGVVLV